MANKQRLQLTLRHRPSGREWTGQRLDITADPDDHKTLLQFAEDMARELDHRGSGGDPWWIGQYSVRVQGLDQEWRAFEVAGDA